MNRNLRTKLAAIAELAIDAMNLIDGDPDDEPGTDMEPEDDLNETEAHRRDRVPARRIRRAAP